MAKISHIPFDQPLGTNSADGLWQIIIQTSGGASVTYSQSTGSAPYISDLVTAGKIQFQVTDPETGKIGTKFVVAPNEYWRVLYRKSAATLIPVADFPAPMMLCGSIQQFTVPDNQGMSGRYITNCNVSVLISTDQYSTGSAFGIWDAGMLGGNDPTQGAVGGAFTFATKSFWASAQASPSYGMNQWNQGSLGAAAADNGQNSFTVSGIKYSELRLNAYNGGGSAAATQTSTVYFTGFYFNPDRIKPTVVLSFDDGYKSLITKVLPILKANKLRATAYINANSTIHTAGGFTDNAGKIYATTGDLQTLVDSGWEISLRVDNATAAIQGTAYSDANTSITRSRLEAGEAFLKSLGIDRSIKTLAWPFGFWDTARAALAKALKYTSCRTTGLSPVQYTSKVAGKLGNLQIRPAYPLTTAAGSQAEDVLGRVRRAASMGGDMHVYVHDVLDSGASGADTTTADFTVLAEGLANDVAAGLYDVLPEREWALKNLVHVMNSISVQLLNITPSENSLTINGISAESGSAAVIVKTDGAAAPVDADYDAVTPITVTANTQFSTTKTTLTAGGAIEPGVPVDVHVRVQ